VWIFCGADADAMAAARIVSYMLRSDGISYQLRPCWTYSSLERMLEEADDCKAILLLNLGASRNLTKLFRPRLLKECSKVYVMDCRRPVHLANVHAGQNIVIFWDSIQPDDVPSDGDNLSGKDDTSSEEEREDSDDDESDEGREDDKDDDSSGGDEEFKDEEFMKKGNGRDQEKASSSDDSDRDYDGEVEDDDTDEPKSPDAKKRKLDDDERVTTKEADNSPEKDDRTDLSPRVLHQQRLDRLRIYYSGGSFYGSPVAWIAFRLASQLRFGNKGDLLWLACVGLTDAYMHARIDLTGYTALSMELKQSCRKLFRDDSFSRDHIVAEELAGTSVAPGQKGTHVSLSETGRILTDQDYRFFLLRHTSLLDSMIYSPYVSTRLQLWTSQGMQRLQELLAKMGFPLDECRQPYAFMKPKFRRQIKEKMSDYALDYGLDKLEFTSFVRVTGYKSLMSASDASYAVTALLESDTPSADSELEAFHIAYDALNSNSCPNIILNEGHATSNLVNGGNLSGNTGIGAGIRLALALQKSILSTAVSLVERNAITRLRHFRYAYITCTSQEAKGTAVNDENEETMDHVFAKPLALTKLAHYLMDMHRENGKWTGGKSRPLVLMAEKPATKTFVIVGYEYPEQVGHFVKNQFGKNFEFVAQTMQGSSFRFDSFDSNVVEVEAGDVQRFVEQLHYLLDST